MQQQYTRRQDDNENLRSYIHKYTRLHREATGKATDEEFDTHNKLHFLSRLRNSTIATKISQNEEFEKFDRYSLKNCIEKALMLESRLQIREMVTIARENLENKDPKVMEMSEEGEEQQEELNILSEDKGPGRFRNPNLANLICYKFSPGGCANSQNRYYFSNFCQKLHENERIWRRLWTLMEENVQRQIKPWSNWRIG